MTLKMIESPFPLFNDSDGSPLENGNVYVGEVNQNPEVNPISVYWDKDLSIPVAQPIRTINGYLSQNGTPGELFAANNYSLTVRDKNGSFILSSPSSIIQKNVYNLADYTVLSDVLSDIGSDEATLQITTFFNVNENVTIPSNVSLLIPNGGQFVIGSGYTVTINSFIDAGIYKIFSGAGAIAGSASCKFYYSQWFGVVGDGLIDDSANMQTCIDNAQYFKPDISGFGKDFERVISLPLGLYMLHEISIDDANKVSFRSTDSTRSSLFIYNGAGGVNSHILSLEKKSFGELNNIVFLGYDVYNGTSTTPIADSLVIITSIVPFDLLFEIRNCQFSMCFGDAIKAENNIYANGLIDHVRFDAVGGFCLTLTGAVSGERRPFLMSRFTVDNNLSAAFATAATAQGYYSSSKWGKGVVNVIEGKGVLLNLDDARIEFNSLMNTNKPCVVYSDLTLGGAVLEVNFNRIIGFFAGSQNDGCMVYSEKSKFLVHSIESFMDSGTGTLVYEATTPKSYYLGSRSVLTSARSSDQQMAGISLQGTKLNRIANFGTSFTLSSSGDLFFKDAYNPQYNTPLSVCSFPRNGFASTGATQNIGTGAITATTATLILSGSFTIPLIGAYITIPGAGIAAADLDTYVTAVNPSANAVTVNDVASTTVSGQTITHQTARFMETNQIVANRRWTSADGNPAASVAYYNSVTSNVAMNREPSASKPDGWVCRGSGGAASSGTWKTLGSAGGTTANRPAYLGTGDIGFNYYDSTITKPVWWTGAAWVDATGAGA